MVIEPHWIEQCLQCSGAEDEANSLPLFQCSSANFPQQLLGDHEDTYKSRDRELRLAAHSGSLESRTALAAEGPTLSRKTVTRTQRLIASLIVMWKRHMASATLYKLWRGLHNRYGSEYIKPLYICCRYKYDEMALTCNTQSATQTKGETLLTKLLQVTASWGAVIQVGQSFLQYHVKVPTIVRPLEKNSARHLREALWEQTQIPSWAKDIFHFQARMPINI